VTLVAVPNVSEGRDEAVLDAIGAAFAAAGARELHRSADPDHHRAVFTLTGAPGELGEAVAAGAAVAAEHIDVSRHAGEHPRVGAMDVAPIVYLSDADRGAACAEALILADRLGELGLPVLLYGALAGGRTRAELRRGGVTVLAERIASGELATDAGPPHAHPTAGVVLVAARPPLAAFNLELADGTTVERAREIAALIREGGAEGLPGVRALGLRLERAGVTQLSTNVEDLSRATPADVLAAVARHAPVTRGELIAPAPRAAWAGWPQDVRLDTPPALEDLL
jgi:glutamate formiminotransferase / 5-formyltetrahydrofolate cyclo-ligase